MIPEIPPLQDSFSALALRETDNSPPSDAKVVCVPLVRTRQGGVRDDYRTTIFIFQTRSSTILLDSLTDRVCDSLEAVHHPGVSKHSRHRASIATKLLALAVLHSESPNQILTSLNVILGAISASRVVQWAVLPNRAESGDLYRFGGFTYGQLDLERLSSRCKRAGSNYFELYGAALRSRISLSREVASVPVVDVANRHVQSLLAGVGSDKLSYRIFDDYFSACADVLKEEFLIEVDRQQALYVAAGLGGFHSYTLRQIESLTHWVTAFTRDSARHGWVVPTQDLPTLSVAEPSAYREGKEEIVNALGLSDWGDLALDPIIQTYCEYLGRAAEMRNKDDIEEAILHSIFALDLLLGGSQNQALTSVISERVSQLSHTALNEEFGAVVAFIRECYDMRSAYAHRGERGKLGEKAKGMSLNARDAKLSQVCRVVLAAACYARRQSWCGSEARTRWLARLDAILGQRRGGEPLAESQLSDLGIEHIHVAADGFVRLERA